VGRVTRHAVNMVSMTWKATDPKRPHSPRKWAFLSLQAICVQALGTASSSAFRYKTLETARRDERLILLALGALVALYVSFVVFG
jgi:hypothetical protein